MAKKEKKAGDFNQIAKSIVEKATSEKKHKKEDSPSPKIKKGEG